MATQAPTGSPPEGSALATDPRGIQFAQVDAFTERPFRGNPAGVCLLPHAMPRDWMQSLAAELNQSETAFLLRRSHSSDVSSSSTAIANPPERDTWQASGPPEAAPVPGVTNPEAEFDIWWFTPEHEEDLCGHATLASAHFLFSQHLVSEPAIVFYNRGQALRAKRVGTGGSQSGNGHVSAGGDKARKDEIELDFPLNPAEEVPREQWVQLADALGGVEVLWAGRSQLDILVELSSPGIVQSLVPDWSKIRKVPTRGLLPTAVVRGGDGCGEDLCHLADKGVDFVSRFFAADQATGEDPVTGSAHCTLTPYWARKLGKDHLTAYQMSSRGGMLGVSVDWEQKRVLLRGTAVTVLQGRVVA